MTTDMEQDDIIMVEEEVLERGFFYLENRQFKGPFQDPENARRAALVACEASAPGLCRAVYQGTVKFNAATQMREPLADMHQIELPAETLAAV
jgi:hypothetical protein